MEALIKEAAVGYYIRSKDHAARFCNANRLAQSLQLILFGVKVIQRPQQQRDIISVVRKCGQVHGVALGDRYVFSCLGIFTENIYVMADQLHRVHGTALTGQSVRIPAGSGSDFKHPVPWLSIFFNVAHRSEKFNRSML